MNLYAPFEPQPSARPKPFAGTVRPAAVSDRGFVADLTLQDAEAMAALQARRDGRPIERARERAQEELLDPRFGSWAIVFVAEDNGEVVGFARARHVDMKAPELPVSPPEGWYLMGVIVDERHRRRGIGKQLTEARLAWIANRSDEAYYFVNRANKPSIALHRALGFVKISEGFAFPRARLLADDGILYRAPLR